MNEISHIFTAYRFVFILITTQLFSLKFRFKQVDFIIDRLLI